MPGPALLIRSLTVLAGLSLSGGCAFVTSGGYPVAPLRAVIDAPARFEVVEPNLRVPPADTIVGQGCRSPLVDPRDQTRLRMVRSGSDGRGDHEVPEGRYGVRPGEVPRVECKYRAGSGDRATPTSQPVSCPVSRVPSTSAHLQEHT